jgi:D-tyrosyl-tRNA(Tyr) deacylase
MMTKTSKKTVYLFCDDLTKDHVAYHVFDAVKRLFPLENTNIVVDDRTVLAFEDVKGNIFYYVQTNQVVSHDYPHYLPILNRYFSDCEFAGIVNWHEGANAPEGVLTVHTTGDVISGYFGAAKPVYVRNLLLAIENNRKEIGLDNFTTVTEATHWSGVLYGGVPELIPQYCVPLVDIEIGSSPDSWSNPMAAEAIALSLPQVFDRNDVNLKSLLCIGGVHFEASFVNAVLNTLTEYPIAVSHILANQWVVSGDYQNESGLKKLEACVVSIDGGIHGVVFHEGLKGPIKEQIRAFAKQLGVPAIKHKSLRQPENLPFW